MDNPSAFAMQPAFARDPVVTIYVPVYNAEKYLSATLESLLAQTFRDFEVIIVNDGSVDHTLKIAEHFAAIDSRIRIISHAKNQGITVTRNAWRSSASATSQYFLGHDGDDISLPTKLQALVEYLEKNPEIDAVGCFAEYFNDDNQIVGSPPIEWKPSKIRDSFGTVNSMIISATLVRRKMFDDIAPFRPGYGGCVDYEFWARALLNGYSLANIPTVLHRIRVHEQSMGATRHDEMEKIAAQIREHYNSEKNKIVAKKAGPRDKLDILHTVEFYAPHIGGAEIVVQQISERLAKRGHRVAVATSQLPERIFRELNGVQIHGFAVRGKMADGIQGDAKLYQQFLDVSSADIMMNYAAQVWTSDLAFPLVASGRNKRVNILAPCGYSALVDESTLRWPHYREYFEKVLPVVLPRYDAVTYHSSIYKDFLYGQNLKLTNGLVIPNGTDEEEFTQPMRINFREKYKLTTPFVGLCVANFYPDKGQERIVDCVRRMNRPDFTMVFIGRDGDQLASLRKQAEGLNIRFVVAPPREETVAAFRSADVFLFGSHIEASPLVIIEAKAAHLPFVSTDCGNVREWKGGVVCAPEEMAKQTTRLLDEPAYRKQLGDEGWREWKEKLTWEAVTDRWEDLYLRLAHAKDGRMAAMSCSTPVALAGTPEKARSQPVSEVVVKLQGGMGNQMFQYAAGLALARRTGASLKLDLSFLLDRTPRPNFTQRSYALDMFPLHQGCMLIKEERSMPAGLLKVTEKSFSFDPAIAALPAGTFLDGYWQSPRYFEGCEAELKNAFELAPKLSSEDKKLAAQIGGNASVCLHVRRGDMVHNAYTASVHGACAVEYYQTACDIMARKIQNVHFYIFSDDPQWCQSNDLTRGRPNTVVSRTSKTDSTAVDLHLMRLCRHFIIANSTFSWWAAYLGGAGDKEVIAPEPWFSSTEMDTTDLLPKNWIRLCRNPGPVLAPSEKAPVVSVIMPCYKQAHYLSVAIESVVAQTFADWELIVVNDGSPDDTSRVTRDIIACHPERRIQLLEKVNGGLADARNAGIKEARGKYILPLDSDDKVHSEMLQKTVSLLEKNPKIAIAYTDLVQFGISSNVLQASEYDFSRLPLQNQLNCCSLFRREAWTAAGGYNPNMKLGYEDWDFWVGCGERGFFGKRIPEPLFFYRVKDSSMYTKAREHHGELHAQLVMNHPKLFNAAIRTEAAQILDAANAKAPLSLLSDEPKKMNNCVTVVIPCYNQAQYLSEAVESVFSQSYKNWEIVIVNDGSPDSTSLVAQGLILNNPTHRIRLIEKQNGGLADARNAGIRFAQGDYILPLDADDKIHPEFLTRTVALLDLHPEIAIAYCDWTYFGAHSTTRNAIEYDFSRLCTKENLFTCTSLYRKTAWSAAGGYNINMTHGVEDWDFWISCGEKGFVGKRIPEALFYYRAKEGSMIHTLQPHLPAMFARIILNHPNLYNSEIVQTARKMFEAAGLPSPKPSSIGQEWLPPVKDLAAFQQIIAAVEICVQENRIEEAIAKIEQALNIAPTEECIVRANEVLESLRASVPDAQNETKAAASDEIFGAEEVQSFEQLATAYSNNPADAGISGQLRELQQGIMNFLVTAEVEQLEGHFKGSLGRVFRALVKSGLPSEAPTEESQGQLAILDEALAGPEAADGSFDYRPLFARILCGPAHRGTLTVAPGRIPAWFLNDYLTYMLHAPQVFVVDGEAEQYQSYLLGVVRSICQRIKVAPGEKLTMDVASFFALKANYIPLYFANCNTRELAEKRAEIMEFVLVKNGAVIDFTPPKRGKNQKKIKVGYLSAHFGAQTETHVTLPTLQLDRAKFEICLFAVEANPGPVEDRCRGFADTFTRLPKQTHEQVATIRNAKLDVLIIGTNVTAVTNQVSLLALHRLAPVQLVSYCSPVSTGMRHVDGYLTGSHMDFPGIQEHFSEKLMVCDGPPGCLDYTVENKGSGARFTREGLGLAADDVVFINAAACFKILPAMQETWAKILKAVPKARLLLLPFNPNWSNAFPVKQFERTLTEACARQGLGRDSFVLVNSLPSRADVKELEKLADVYLDTFPFSGSISVIDPLELGIPSVVWEGKTPRSRMASALLRELGMTELITQDEESYIRLSIKLATEPAYRRQISDRIASAMARNPRFTDAKAYAQGLGNVIESLVVAAPRSVPAAAAAV